ncbi:MAG: NAD+ synthase [Flavobacteriales bacterium]|nr:NAD+ synthase [Flavobacteriales bacterium]
MKIALAQINTIIGHFEYNVRRIQAAILEAEEAGARLVVFPELSICGYPPQDFLEFQEFIDSSLKAVEDIARFRPNMPVVLGAPMPNPHVLGKNLLNCALWLQGGKIHHQTAKALLPNYDVFDEYRYFESGRRFETVAYEGYRFALTVCEDIWDTEEDRAYVVSPPEAYIPLQPHFLINISASPFHPDQQEARYNAMGHWCARLGVEGLYCNSVGAQTELIFDGGSFRMNARGAVTHRASFFTEDLLITDHGAPPLSDNDPDGFEKVYQALLLGLRDYFSKQGFRKAIVGLSGGIDSALVTVLATRALGPDNVLALLMPSPFSSEHSVTDSMMLCENLGIRYEVLPIGPVFETFLKTLERPFKNTEFGVAEENLQSRIRAALLMALSNKKGYVLLNTSNKSELAVGYGTLYGDMCGALSVLGDIYKTGVYMLARFINQTAPCIPENILTKEPSAELRPGQKDSDSLPPYPLLDMVLSRYIEGRQGPDKISRETGLDKNLVLHILRLVNQAEFKRRQAPPVLRVTPKAFGPGRRLPIVGKYLE